jgi:hypothetical protein
LDITHTGLYVLHFRFCLYGFNLEADENCQHPV